MFLVQLDSNNAAIVVTSLSEIMVQRRLTADHVLAFIAPQLGQVFDNETSAFLPPVRRRWITKLAFDSRFTMDEATALKRAQMAPVREASETDTDFNARCDMAAKLQVLQSRLNMASYIDLDRADTVAGVQILETLGLLTEGRATAILEGAIADAEYHPTA